MTDRVQRMRKKYFHSRPCITAERLVLQTEGLGIRAGRGGRVGDKDSADLSRSTKRVSVPKDGYPFGISFVRVRVPY